MSLTEVVVLCGLAIAAAAAVCWIAVAVAVHQVRKERTRHGAQGRRRV